VGVGVGAAALVTALVAADLRAQVAEDVATHENNYGKGCARGDPRLCAYDIEVTNRDADRADTMRDASLWLGIGAGVLVAGGVVLVIFSGSGDSKESASQERFFCTPAPGGMGCAGTF
jgi:hypothetical protein